MDASARWNTPLQTLHFVLSVALCTIPNYLVLIKFSSTFCLERCLVYNTKLFTAHQILNFCKKNFRRVDIVMKIMKFFYYENLELYGIYVYVHVITQQGGVCMIYMHDAWGCAAPEGECIYIRQIPTYCVITNIFPTLY